MENTTRIMIIDTETTNSIDDPIVYDLGYEIFDLDGLLYDRNSFVNADVFLDEELMSSAYFIDKIPQYWKDIKNGKRELRRWRTITDTLYKTIRDNDVKIIVAHNARFDYRSIHLTQRYETASRWRWVFPYGVEWWDSLTMARQILKDDEAYNNFCFDNGFVTANGKPRFTAEVLYKFITNDLDFEESHTGLEDVQIERKIFEYLLSLAPSIDGRLWNE